MTSVPVDGEIKTSVVPVSVDGAVSAPRNSDAKVDVDAARTGSEESCVYVLTGDDRRSYSAWGGGSWTVRSTFAVCRSVELAIALLRQNAAAADNTRYAVACYKVELDRLLAESDSESTDVVRQPVEVGTRLNLQSLIAAGAIPPEEREKLLYLLDPSA